MKPDVRIGYLVDKTEKGRKTIFVFKSRLEYSQPLLQEAGHIKTTAAFLESC